MIQSSFSRAIVTALALLTPGFAFAQVNSAAGTDVTVTATLPGSLTVSLDAVTLAFPLTAGSALNPGATPINATTSWSLSAGHTAVILYAYFDSPAALVSGSATIANTLFTAKVDGGASLPFTAIVPFGAAYAVQILNETITALNLVGSKVSVVTLNIDLSSAPTQAAGTYTGTLHFRAQATP